MKQRSLRKEGIRLERNILFLVWTVFLIISLTYGSTFVDNDSGDFGKRINLYSSINYELITIN